MALSTYAHIQNEWSLREGFQKSYAHKSASQRSKREVAKVMDDLDNVCATLHKQLLAGTYQVGQYRHYILHDRKKDRNISVLPFIDRGVQNTEKDAVEPVIINQLTDQMTGGLPQRGISSKTKKYSTIHQMEREVRNRSNHSCILLDIHHCYDSINNIVIMRLIEKCIHDKRMVALIRQQVFNQPRLAIGDPFSHLMSNLVISRIIRALKEAGCKHVVNFADNIAIFGKDHDEVRRFAKIARLEACHQRLHFNKAYVFDIDRVGKVSFCGRVYYRNKTLLRRDTKQRIVRARNKKRSWASYKGILDSCNCKHLTKIIKQPIKMEKARTPFAGKAVKVDAMLGIKHTIVAKEVRKSKQKDSDTYYDVQAIAEGLGLIRYTTSSKLLVQTLKREEIPIRDLYIKKDWRGFFYDGSIFTNEEEADIIRKEFNINY